MRIIAIINMTMIILIQTVYLLGQAGVFYWVSMQAKLELGEGNNSDTFPTTTPSSSPLQSFLEEGWVLSGESSNPSYEACMAFNLFYNTDLLLKISLYFHGLPKSIDKLSSLKRRIGLRYSSLGVGDDVRSKILSYESILQMSSSSSIVHSSSSCCPGAAVFAGVWKRVAELWFYESWSLSILSFRFDRFWTSRLLSRFG